MSHLVEAAKAAPAQTGRRNTDRWLGVVSILRGKGYTYRAIWQWLREQGEDVHADFSTFAGAVSKRYRRHIQRQAQ